MKVWEERDLATETRRRCHVVQFNNFIRWFEWTWKSRHWTENNYFTQASFSSLTENHRNTFLTLTNSKGTIIKISNLTLHWPLAPKLATCFNESEGSFYKISCETTLCNVVTEHVSMWGTLAVSWRSRPCVLSTKLPALFERLVQPLLKP